MSAGISSRKARIVSKLSVALVSGLAAQMVACGERSSSTESPSARVFGGASNLGGPITISDEDKARLDQCIHERVFAQELTIQLAQMACYGGDPQTARLRAAASLECSPVECQKEISFTRTGPKIEIRAAAVASGGMGGNIDMYPIGASDPRYAVWVGIIVRPGFYTRKTKCTAYSAMPGWPEHIASVESEIARACGTRGSEVTR